MRTAVLTVVVLSVFASRCAAEKVTVDPNTANVGTVTEDTSGDKDERLGKNVTYEAKRKSVLAILTDLSEKTGVAFRAGYNNQDWQVRDRKMNIFAKDVPLASLMNSIARVMKFKWRWEAKDGVRTYRLIMDRKTILDAETQKQREEERLAQLGNDRRRNALDSLTKVADLSPEELARLKKDNPFMYMIAEAGIAKPLTSLLSESPAILEALGTGKALSLDGGSLSPAAQQALTATMAGTYKLQSLFEGGNRTFPEDFLANIGQAQVQINRNLEREQAQMGVSPFLGEIRVEYAGRNFELPLFDPNGRFAQVLGKAVLQVMDLPEDQRKDQLNESAIEKEMMQAVVSDVKSLDQPEKPVKRLDDPALHVKIKIELKASSLTDVQEALAKAAKVAVVSDNFGTQSMFGRVNIGEAELRTVLQQIEDNYRYDWEKHGPVIEFTDRKWYQKRAAQIPDAWIEGWKETLKKTGTLDLKDLAQIACLTQEQFETNVDEDPLLSAVGTRGIMYMARDLLRLYAALTEDQRKLLFSSAGVDVRALSPEQLQAATKLIRGRSALFMRTAGAAVIITAERKQKEDGRVRYVFTVTTDEGPQPLMWQTDLPVYKEPAKDKPEGKKQDAPKTEPAKPQQ